MSRAVLHAARGSRPAVPGRGATAPNCVRSTSCRAAGRRQRASSDAHQNLKAASNSIFCARAVVNRSAAGGAAGVCVAQDWCSS